MTDNKKQENRLAVIAGFTSEERINSELEGCDDFKSLILLLNRINEFQPREKWIIPILKSRECSDFKTQLLTVVEDYEGGNNGAGGTF